ncbi:MAG: hypothetical protein ICV74_05580 [Thermoleophilia bacterium]|nr:hypothetical protein [Thermoleophilia bacterium]
MPRYLTLGAIVLALWLLAYARTPLTAALPAAVVLVAAACDYALWVRRRKPWHDWTVIVLLLPAIAASVWVAVGGLMTGVERSDGERLLAEVGPGVALTGILCTLISYHGRHHPGEGHDFR